MKQTLFFMISCFMIGCASEPKALDHSSPYTVHGKYPTYIVSHGWHTGIVIPAAPIKTAIPELAKRFATTPYLEFGWGDRGFYQAKEIDTSLVLQAIFWPTESVIHAVAVPENVESFFYSSQIKKLCLNESELQSLVKFIGQSFSRSGQGHVIPLDHGIYGNSQFYQGAGNYYLFNTCNKWTAKALKSIGMNIDPQLKLSSGSVMSALSDFETDLTGQSCISDKNHGNR